MNRSFRSGSTQHYEKKSSNVLIYNNLLAKRFFEFNKNFGESLLCIWLFRPIPQNSRTLQGASRLAAPIYRGGKSGQQRAPYFLTGRALIGDGQSTASATENKPPLEMAKTCLVHLPEERVKRWGKSPPPPQ